MNLIEVDPVIVLMGEYAAATQTLTESCDMLARVEQRCFAEGVDWDEDPECVEVREAQGRLCDQQREVMDKIAAQPATTPQGARKKLDLWKEWSSHSISETIDALGESARRDIELLARSRAAAPCARGMRRIGSNRPRVRPQRR